MRLLATLTAIAASLSLVVACGGGGDSGSSSNNGASTRTGFQGVAQKGPLIFGSNITVFELDAELNETGRSFSAQTTDDLGNFTVRARLDTDIVKMIGVGYYMDELSGGLSAAPVSMTAIADLSVDPTPTINILTTLAAPRVVTLMQTGVNYVEALNQAQREVLAVFGIESTKIEGLKALFTMSISGSSDQDAALLATSTVLSQAAANAALGGSTAAAQLSYFLSRISSDVANFGELRNTSIQTAIDNASRQVNLAGVRANVQTYYASRGLNITAPKFEEWIDKSGSGILPQRIISVDDFDFLDQTVEVGVTINSNAINVTGLLTNQAVQVALAASSTNSNNSTALSSNVKLLKNNSLLNSNYTTALNDDDLAVQLKSDSIGSIVTATVSVGSIIKDWRVTTRTPQVLYSKVGNCSAPQTANNKFFALPFSLPSDSTINYIGAGIGASTAPNRVSIYTNNTGVPGTPLITTTTISDGGFISGSPYPQAQLSPSRSFSVSANTTYWIVFEYDVATTPGALNNSCVTLDNGGLRKMSSDGTTWINWTGSSGNSEDGSATNAPGFFIAD